ncbi:MAG: A/G-specific adenine glycosylase [Bacteroidetes bacterium]|nr:A/G-specific adenine glycosylase [Bacteroidota bacterium]
MQNITNKLIEWYSLHKRNLPWRETRNPYAIWVSEIILQQTRVNQGLGYYLKFMETFPDIHTLAAAPMDQLLKVWQGLGYYTRARNMHFTAQDIVQNYNGIFPNSYKDLIKLKGIGDYTASAIASISFKEPSPVLDGNVFRVIARIYGISESTQSAQGKKNFKGVLTKLIPHDKPGVFNQAIMEFGALQCTPKNPLCEECIFKSSCFALNNNLIDDLPRKKVKVKQTKRYFNFLHILYNDSTFVEQRTENDIWKLLYQFPLIETSSDYSLNELEKTNLWKQIFNNIKPQINLNYSEKKHQLSHQKLYVKFYEIRINTLNSYINKNFRKVSFRELENLGIPILLENYLADFNK